MKYFEWDVEKNEKLKKIRQITFEEALFCLMHGGLLDAIEHPNKDKYPNQKIFIINIDDYAYLVPFVEKKEYIFLKTIIPSRKMTKKYLEGNKDET